MANPRQRRKSRSSTAKASQSKQSRKNMKKVTVKGPQVLVDNWDRTMTVRQNYRKLGLMPKLNPRQAGGIEPIEPVPFALAQQTDFTMQDLEELDEQEEDDSEDEDTNQPIASTSTLEPSEKNETNLAPKLTKGLGRIVRDSNGKVIKIILPGEDGEEVEEEIVAPIRRQDEIDSDDDETSDEENSDRAPNKPWGESMAEWSGEGSDDEVPNEVVNNGPRKTGQGIAIGAKAAIVAPKTDVVRELEALAANQRSIVRHTSEFEADWLVSLVAKYGQNVDKMVHDRKANVWQKTAGEIKRAVKKAGGFAELEKRAKQLPS